MNYRIRLNRPPEGDYQLVFHSIHQQGAHFPIVLDHEDLQELWELLDTRRSAGAAIEVDLSPKALPVLSEVDQAETADPG